MARPYHTRLGVGEEDGGAVGGGDAQRHAGRGGHEAVEAGIEAGRIHRAHLRAVHLPGDGERVRGEAERFGEAATVLSDAGRIVGGAQTEVERGVRRLAHAAVPRREGGGEAGDAGEDGGAEEHRTAHAAASASAAR